MDTHTQYISLYSGGGGLDLGFKLANPNARAVCYVEREASAIALLVDHMQTGQLDDAPLWSDSGTFDGEPWRGKVDFIIGGFPCQPFSVAGTRVGTTDERWLWPHIARLVRQIRPNGLFLENVPGLFHGGIEHVLGDLASLGFDADWISVRASDVGAPHRRERVFILAVANNSDGRERDTRTEASERAVNRPSVDERELADTTQPRRLRELGNAEGIDARTRESGASGSEQAGGRSSELAHTVSERGRSGNSGRQHAEHAFPPGPGAGAEWRDILERYPELAPAVEPEVRGMVDGVAGGLARTDRLRILGNGVVPQQAAYAFRELEKRMNTDRFYKRA